MGPPSGCHAERHASAVPGGAALCCSSSCCCCCPECSSASSALWFFLLQDVLEEMEAEYTKQLLHLLTVFPITLIVHCRMCLKKWRPSTPSSARW